MLLVVVRANLVLDYENDAACDEDGVCPLAHTGDREFQEKETVVQSIRHLLQVRNLRLPCNALVLINSKRVVSDELAKDRSR